MSEQAGIHERMATILSELPAIGKDTRNDQQGFMFRSHDDVLNALNPLLAKHQVFVVPSVIDRAVNQRQTSKGSIMFEVNLHVGYRFYGPAGDYVEASAWGEGTDMGDKATNKAMTMAFKNVLNQSFAISTAETVDSDAHTPEETVSAPRRAPSAPAPGVGGPVEPPRSGSRAKLSSQAAADGDASSAGGADGDAFPFKPPADALGLRASRADAPPADGGDPGDVVIHFSKNAGKKLSELSKKQLEWYANEWTPNPQYANAADRRLKVAAQILANGQADPAPVGGGQPKPDIEISVGRDDPTIPF